MRFLAVAHLLLAGIAAGGAAAQTAAAQSVFEGVDPYRLASRTALVIGVGDVGENSGFPSLKNPVRDAAKVAAELRRIKFRVVSPNESYPQDKLTRQVIKAAVYDFATMLRSVGGVGLVYFAGHGIERNGKHYLAPHGAAIRFERDFEEELLPLELFYDAFEFAGNPLNIVVVDACRDNPWQASLQQFGTAVLTRAASPESVRGKTIVATSSLSGSKALDGSDTHSPYALAFLESLKKADRSAGDFFTEIAAEMELLREKYPSISIPEMSHRGSQQFIFVPTVESFNREKSTYENAKRAGNRAMLRRLTLQHAGGYFYKAAMECLSACNFAPEPAAVSGPQPGASDVGSAGGAFDIKGSKWSTGASAIREISGLNWFASKTVLPRGRDVYAEIAGVPEQPKTQTTTVPISFEAGGQPGVEVLAADSVARMTEALKAAGPWIGTKISVVGRDYRGKEKIVRDDLKMLARQALVVGALADNGFHDVAARIAVRTTDVAGDHGRIDLVIDRLAGPVSR